MSFKIVDKIVNVIRDDGKSQSLDLSNLNSFIKSLKSEGLNDYITAAIVAVTSNQNGVKPVEENLEYKSEDSLKSAFSSFFKSPVNNITPLNAKDFIGNPIKLGNFVYYTENIKKYKGVDDGLGNNENGDGYKYRSRGLVGIRGKSNYRKWSQKINNDLVNNPDELLKFDLSLSVLIEFYKEGIKTKLMKDTYSYSDDLGKDIDTYSKALDVVSHINAGINLPKNDVSISSLIDKSKKSLNWIERFFKSSKKENSTNETEQDENIFDVDNNPPENIENKNSKNTQNLNPNLLTQLFPPTISPSKISFDSKELSKQQKSDFIVGAGTAPLVYYNGIQIEYDTISFFNIYHEGMLPAIDFSFSDRFGIFRGVGFPLDDTTVTVFIYSRTARLRSIYMEFKITSFEDLGDNQFRIVGLVNVPELFIKKFTTYSNKTSHETLQAIAKECGLGFCSNIDNTKDKMNWINIGQSSVEYMSNIVTNSYSGDNSFLSCYIDYYYNICYVDLEKEIKRDNSNDVGYFNTGISQLGFGEEGEETLSKLFLTTDLTAINSNMFISDFEVKNNSTKISLNKSYLTKTKYYDSVTKKLLVFDIDSLSSPEGLSLKGKPADSKFYEKNVGNAYLGKMDVFDDSGGGNVHANYNYAIIQNMINLTELSKLFIELTIPNPNYNIYIFQKLFIGLVHAKPGLTQEGLTHKRLTGNWLVTGISYFYDAGRQYQKVYLNRRDLEKNKDEEKFIRKMKERFEDNFNPLSPEDSQYISSDNEEVNLQSLPVVSPSKTPNREFWTLVAIVSKEDNNPQAWADIAQSIYNRLGSGVYGGRTIADLVLGKGQYEPTWKYPRPGKQNIPNKEWMNIQSIEDASKATLNSVSYLRGVANALKNKQLQENARKFIQGRTDFFGVGQPARKMRGKIQRGNRGNQFGWNNNYVTNKLYYPPKQISQFFT